MTVHASEVLQERFVKYKGRPLGLLQAVAGSMISERLARRRRWKRGIGIIQAFLRMRNTAHVMESKQDSLVERLTLELHTAQRYRITNREGGTRGSIESDERMEMAYIMKQSGSFLGPLFLRVRQDHQLLEMEKRKEIKLEEVAAKQRIIDIVERQYVSFADEQRAKRDAHRRRLLTIAEPFCCEENLRRMAQERQEWHERKRIEEGAKDVMKDTLEKERKAMKAAKIAAKAQRVAISGLFGSAKYRNEEEHAVVETLHRPSKPYDIDYSLYWGNARGAPQSAARSTAPYDQRASAPLSPSAPRFSMQRPITAVPDAFMFAPSTTTTSGAASYHPLHSAAASPSRSPQHGHFHDPRQLRPAAVGSPQSSSPYARRAPTTKLKDTPVTGGFYCGRI